MCDIGFRSLCFSTSVIGVHAAARMSANCFVPKGSQAEKLVYWFVASRVLIDIKQASAYNRYMVARGDGVNLSAIGERQGVIGPNRCLFSGGGPICMEMSSITYGVGLAFPLRTVVFNVGPDG